jgi:methanogenic corrinoid protein MtbC1
MVDYLSWLASVLAARAIPAEHLAQSLDWLAEFFAEHMIPADAAVVTAALTAARTRFLQAGVGSILPPVSPNPWPEAADFEAALLRGDHREAMAIVNTCLDSKRDLVQVEIHVVQPALYQIGEKWQSNEVSVAQEHMATAIAKSVMTMALLRSVPGTPVNKRVLLACVEGNNHDVGLHMVADSFQLAGWDVQFLGANMPTRALLQQVVEWKPNLIGLSVSFAQQLRAVRELIALLGERLGDARPPVIIGGLAVNRFAGLAGLVGAAACQADAQAAVACANELVSA